jgi:hypothetical protein
MIISAIPTHFLPPLLLLYTKIPPKLTLNIARRVASNTEEIWTINYCYNDKSSQSTVVFMVEKSSKIIIVEILYEEITLVDSAHPCFQMLNTIATTWGTTLEDLCDRVLEKSPWY